MDDLRNRVNGFFYKLGDFVYENPYKVLISIFLILGALFTQLPEITVDISTEGFFHEKDPALIDYNKFRDEFGRDELILIAVYTDDVFTFEFLKKLKKLHKELEAEVPYLDEVTSLVNIRNTRGENDELIVEDFLEKWPENKNDLENLRKLALENRMYENYIISKDAKITTIAIETQTYSSSITGDTSFKTSGGQSMENFSMESLSGFDDEITEADLKAGKKYLTDVENSKAVEAVEKIAAKYNGKNFEVHITGSAAVTHFIKDTMMKDVRKFIGLAVLTIGLVLFLMFRRFTGVILPLFVTVLSLLVTVSLMALSEKAVKLPTQILPSFILAVSVGYSVHIISLFYKKFNETLNKKEAVVYSVGHSGLAIVLTAITTAGGLFSFSTAEIAPVADLGIFAGFGVFISMIITFLLLPALISVFPIKAAETENKSSKISLFDEFLIGISRFSIKNSKIILFITIFLFGASIAGALKIQFSHAPLEWLPRDNSIRTATEMVDEDLRGSVTLEAVLDTKKKNGLYEPDFMKRLESSESEMEKFKSNKVFVGKVTSISSILKETNKALNENRNEFYTVPLDRDLIAQELLLFENSGSDDLLDFTESQLQKARLILKAPFKDALLYKPLIHQIKTHLETKYPDCEITITGMMVLFFETLANAVETMAKSYIYALLAITFFMILLIGDLKMGLLSMVPNLTSIFITLGIIGWFNIPMNLFTMLVGNIAIGLAVDDTIHFMHNFRLYYNKSKDVASAANQTFITAGRAMFVTSLVLSIGFFIFMFAGMNNLFDFGLLTGITILTALLANFFVTPALLAFLYRH